MFEKILQWDRDTFIYLNSLGNDKYDSFWSAITNFYTWVPLFILFIYLFFKKFPKKDASYMIAMLLFMALLVAGFTDFVKEFFVRLRPNNEVEINTIIRVVKNPSSYSFFSGHAASSFSITTLVFLFLRKKFSWSSLFYIWPLLFAYSRIYLGVHYPSDIMVGTLIGVVSAILFYQAYKKLIQPC